MVKEDADAHYKELDTALAQLKNAKTTRMFYALVIKGGSEGTLLVSRTKIGNDRIADAKKRGGGTFVVQGTCYTGEDGICIFETDKPPAPAWAKMVQDTAKKHTKHPIHAHFELVADTAPTAAATKPATPAATPAASPVSLASALWRKTREKADAEVNRLCDVLRRTGDEALVEAADKLAGIGGKFKVDLTIQLLEFDRAEPSARPKVHDRIHKILQAYQQLVTNDREIAAADNNPFHIPVRIRVTTLAALQAVGQQVDKMMAAPAS